MTARQCFAGCMPPHLPAHPPCSNVATSVCEGQGKDVENGECFNKYWVWALIHG